jgi:hypothetical protein
MQKADLPKSAQYIFVYPPISINFFLKAYIFTYHCHFKRKSFCASTPRNSKVSWDFNFFVLTYDIPNQVIVNEKQIYNVVEYG